MKFILSILVIFLLIGCTSNIERIRLAYQAGDYETVSELLTQELAQSPIPNETLEFLQSYGDPLIKKGFRKAQRFYQKNQYLECMDFLSAYIFVLESFDQKEYFPDIVPAYLDQSIELFNEAKKQFVSIQYKLGVRAFNSNRYRLSYSHFNELHQYIDSFKDSVKLETASFKLAQRHVSISPFIKLADPIELLVNKTISQFIGGHVFENFQLNGVPLIIDNVDIKAQFNQEIMSLMEQKKSDFLTVTYDSIAEEIPNSDYYVEGIIDATSRDFSGLSTESTQSDTLLYRYNTTEEWQEFPFHYSIKQYQTSILISVKADIYLSKTDDKVGSIYFDKSFEDIVRLRGDIHSLPIGTPMIQLPSKYLQLPEKVPEFNSRYVIEQAIMYAANEFSNRLLTLIDKDRDPLSLKNSSDL